MPTKKFDPSEPFSNKQCYDDFLAAFKSYSFKLYGKLKFRVIYKSKYEFDLNAGEIHYTEVDFEGLSVISDKLNKKWGTDITFCLFPAKNYPLSILINVRSPKAPVETRV